MISDGDIEKMNDMNKLKITIVTVSYNANRLIRNTLLSVINQTYSNIEYIVVDGGSNDGTVEIIKQYEKALDYWVSEPDKGIYDAMNKGINKATGDYIIFMNSGDSFVSNETVERIFCNRIDDNSIVYGKTIGNYGMVKLSQPLNPFFRNLSYCAGVGICHQSVFVPTKLAKMHPFNLRYKVCADYDMLHKLYSLPEVKFTEIEEFVAEIICDEGFSDKNLHLKLKENALIVGVDITSSKFKKYLHKSIMKQKLRMWIKFLEPSCVRKYRFKKKKNFICNL